MVSGNDVKCLATFIDCMRFLYSDTRCLYNDTCNKLSRISIPDNVLPCSDTKMSCPNKVLVVLNYSIQITKSVQSCFFLFPSSSLGASTNQ